MKILTVEMTNYGPFKGRHVFALSDRGLVLVLGENRDELRMNNNGSGKTSLFDAVDWCLWGQVPKKDHVDSIIHDQTADEGVDVTVNLVDDDETPIVVRRFRNVEKKSGAELRVGTKDLTALDTKETQSLIDRVLGMDRDVYHAVIYYAQEDRFNFADATDAERMSVMTRILQLDAIDEWLERAKLRVKEYDTDILSRKTKLATLEGQVSGMDPTHFDHQASAWEEERAQSLREATRQLNEHLSNIETWKKTVVFEERCRTNLMVLETAANTTLDMTDFDRQIAMHRHDEQKAIQVLAATETEGKSLRARYEKIKAFPVGECSECGQPVTKDHLEREAAKLEPELERLRVLYMNHNAEVVRLRALVQAAEQERERQRMIHYEADKANQAKLQEARDQMRTVDEAKRYIMQAESHCAHLRGLMATTQQKANPWREKQAEIVSKRQQVEQQILESQQSVAQLEDERRYVEFWVDGFGPKGLKSYILDSRLQEMTDAANEWVKLLTGGTIWVRFETQTQGRSTGKLSNKINLRLWRYNRDGTVTERNYRSWSGGEKKRVSWAVDFGLSRLVAARATKRYDTLILDEVFTHVDRAGGEAVVEMLNKLRDEKSSIFVVEQNSDFQNHFEETLVVRKEHGCSRVIREDDDDVQGISGEGQEAPRTESAEKPKRKKKGKRVPAGAPGNKKRAPRSTRADR